MVHIHDSIDFTVEAFLVHEDKVLLRYHDKYYRWLSVGGHIKLNEDPVQALKREVLEEVGHENIEIYNPRPVPLENSVDFTHLIPPLFLNRHRISPTHEHVTLTYGARTNTYNIKPREAVKTVHTWCTLDEITAMRNTQEIDPRVAHYATTILHLLKNNLNTREAR